MDTEQTKNEPAAENAEQLPAESKKDANEAQEPETHEDIVVTENEKAYGAALRKLLGIAENEELGDLESRITEYETKTAAALAAAKEQVIAAELKALTGYDTKLLDRLIDRSKLTVDENGKVTGIEEAVRQVAEEFPAVIRRSDKKPFVPIAAGTDEDTKPTMNDLIRGKR